MPTFCPNCGFQVAEGSGFCGNCGAKIQPQQQKSFCGICGLELPAGTAFCPRCGSATAQGAPNPPSNPGTPANMQYGPAPVYQQVPAAPQGYAVPAVPVIKKKSKGWIAIPIIAVILVAAFLVTAFVFPGFLKRRSAGSLDSLRNYASWLDDIGNFEAASAVYNLISGGGGAEKIEEERDDNPVVSFSDEFGTLSEIFGKTGGRK